MCADCGLKTSATAGTIFHRSHTPLSTWFAALWFVTSSRNGVSARGLQTSSGSGHTRPRGPGWTSCVGLGNHAGDVVELDQSFLGGRSTGKLGASSNKVPITIAVERTTGGRLGRVRLELADKPGGLDIIDFASQVVAPGATIHTDGARMFTRLADLGYTHHATPSSKAGHKVEDPDAVMAGPHLVPSLLKRWTAGTLHHRLSSQHMPYYLDEFTFRFNRRTSRARGMLFYRLLQQSSTPTLTHSKT